MLWFYFNFSSNSCVCECVESVTWLAWLHAMACHFSHVAAHPALHSLVGCLSRRCAYSRMLFSCWANRIASGNAKCSALVHTHQLCSVRITTNELAPNLCQIHSAHYVSLHSAAAMQCSNICCVVYQHGQNTQMTELSYWDRLPHTHTATVSVPHAVIELVLSPSSVRVLVAGVVHCQISPSLTNRKNEWRSLHE